MTRVAGSVPDLVAVPAGVVRHGDSTGKGDPDERPVRTRAVAAFAIGATPVTCAQYLHYLRETGLHRESRPDLHAFPAGSATGLHSMSDGTVTCPPAAADQPVVHTTWDGACAYARWLGEVLGTGVRLPEEAEWEYAAGGPDATVFALGDAFDRSLYWGDSDGPDRVGRRPASPFGLYDITGNVFEWCLDRYHVPPGDPEPVAVLPDSRLIKGGAFILRGPRNFRTAKRFSAHRSSCLDCVGFRVLSTDPAGRGE